MKRTFLSFALAAVATSLSFAQPSLADDLVVATDTAFVPFEFKEGDKYVGFCPKCGARVQLLVCPDGVDDRFFVAK